MMSTMLTLTDWRGALWLLGGMLLAAAAGCDGPTSVKVGRGNAGAAQPGAPSPEPAFQAEPQGDAPLAAAEAGAVEETPPPAEAPRRRDGDDGPGFSGDTESPSITQRYRTSADPATGGARFAIDSDLPDPSVDRFAVPADRPAADSSRFLAESAAIVAPGLAHHPQGARAAPEASGWEWVVPDGFTAIASGGETSDGFPWRIRCDQDEAIMALVPEGPFVQGFDGGPPNAAPAHGVVLSAFYIDIREVTCERYEKFRAAMREAGRRIAPPARAPADRREPVTGVSWADAQAYARWAKKDLPTESEWEKAARGVDGAMYPWGEGPPVWQRPRRPGQIDRVGAFPADLGPFGLYDMAGNAREWCSDWYVDDAYPRRVADGVAALRNPAGPKSAVPGNLRVVRGASEDWSLVWRAGVQANDRPEDVGFRCVVRMKRVRAKGSD